MGFKDWVHAQHPESEMRNQGIHARSGVRRGQFYLDFVGSENSNGFHAPQEAARIPGEAIDLFRQGQVSLRPLASSARPAGDSGG